MLLFRHVFGFLIQLLPGAFVCCYPFWGRFKFAAKKAVGIACGMALAGCALFVWLGLYPPVPALAAHYQLVCNLVFNLTLASLAAYFLVIIRVGLFQKVFVLSIGMNYSFLLLKLIDFLLQLFQIRRDGYMYSLTTLLFHVIINALLFYPILRLLQRIRRAVDSPIESRTWRQLALVPLGFIFIINLFQYFPEAAGLSPQMTLEIFTMAVLAFMFGVYAWIFRVIERSRRQAEESAVLQATLDNYRRISGNVDRVKEMHHEVKHHLAALNIYLESGDPDGAKAYLRQMADEISRLPAVEYTPNPLLNSILTDYKEKAERAGIRVEYHILVPEAIHMEDIDLCRLLTNMLDNAIEGCADAKEEKYLFLHIRRNGPFLFFNCENACDGGKIRYERGRMISRKPDRAEHGYGLKIMTVIANKYNGLFKVEVEGDRFIVLANLCLFTDDRETAKEEGS